MENETQNSQWGKCCKKMNCSTGCGAYGLAFLGAAVYYIQNASTFWMGVLGVLKALVWPVFLVYKLMQFMGM